jgi:hypothetical protein
LHPRTLKELNAFAVAAYGGRFAATCSLDFGAGELKVRKKVVDVATVEKRKEKMAVLRKRVKHRSFLLCRLL